MCRVAPGPDLKRQWRSTLRGFTALPDPALLAIIGLLTSINDHLLSCIPASISFTFTLVFQFLRNRAHETVRTKMRAGRLHFCI